MTPVRLDSAAPHSRDKHSTTEPLRSLKNACPEKQTEKTLIKYDLGLYCLSGPFWQATSFRNFSKFTLYEITCIITFMGNIRAYRYHNKQKGF